MPSPSETAPVNGFPVLNRVPALVISILTLLCAGVIAPALSEELPVDCASDLDRAVSLHSNGEEERARVLLETLDSACQRFPQIAHNLGVLAGRTGDWETALQYFERSIAADSRAAMSLDHLRQIHRYRASQAWSKALDASLDPSAKAPAPTLSLQDSSIANSESARASNAPSEFRTRSTIEYELFDWWQSASSNNQIGWMAHYSRDFPAPSLDTVAQLDWDELSLTIALTQHDAVVVVTHPVTSPSSSSGKQTESNQPSLNGTLMLMRLEGNRWKIYEQSPL